MVAVSGLCDECATVVEVEVVGEVTATADIFLRAAALLLLLPPNNEEEDGDNAEADEVVVAAGVVTTVG
jgi:hypothetical protein